MRHSHFSQGFAIIPSTLEPRGMNETQVTMSGTLTQFGAIYPSCQLNSMYTNLLLQKEALTSFSRKEQIQSFKVEMNLSIFDIVLDATGNPKIKINIYLLFPSLLISDFAHLCPALWYSLVCPMEWQLHPFDKYHSFHFVFVLFCFEEYYCW